MKLIIKYIEVRTRLQTRESVDEDQENVKCGRN